MGTMRNSGFTTRPDLAQHFLRSRTVAQRLVDLADLHDEAVLEIGAGLGTLSRTVADQGNRIWAVERDERLSIPLNTALAPFADRATVVIDDIRALDLDLLLPDGSVLLSVLPLDWHLALDLTTHVFTHSTKLARGLVVVPHRAAELLAAGAWLAAGLKLEEVDGISRGEFWPEPSMPLRVVSIGRL